MRKLTLDEFVEKARLVHGDKYDYNIIGNEKCTDYIDITCKKHNYT